jgi:hypothetical protein
MGMQEVGLSQRVAGFADSAISILGSAGAGLAGQAIKAGGLSNVAYYEAGQSTISAAEYAKYGAMDPVSRGMQRVAEHGWLKSLTSGVGNASQFPKTVPQGLTPVGYGAMAQEEERLTPVRNVAVVETDMNVVQALLLFGAFIIAGLIGIRLTDYLGWWALMPAVILGLLLTALTAVGVVRPFLERNSGRKEDRH